MSENITTGEMPVLALRGLTVFPDQSVHFDVGRMKSIKALEQAMKDGSPIFLVPQKNIMTDDPELEDLVSIGCVAKVKQILRPQGETMRVLVNGLCRGRISEMLHTEPYLRAVVTSVPEAETVDSPRNHSFRSFLPSPSC